MSPIESGSQPTSRTRPHRDGGPDQPSPSGKHGPRKRIDSLRRRAGASRVARLLERGALLRGLLSGDTAQTGPVYVNVDITHRCNLRCVACRWHSPLLHSTLLDREAGLDFPYEVFEPACEALGRAGTHTMIFCGAGEPFLHPRILDFIACARSNGIEVVVYTNGTLFTEERVDAVLASGLDVCRVSVWSDLGEETGSRDRLGSQQKMDAALEGLERLARRKAQAGADRPTVEVTFPIGPWNMNRLDELVGLATRGLCDRLRFSVTVDFRKEELRGYCLTTEDTARIAARLQTMKSQLDASGVEHNIVEVLRRYSLGERAWERMPCYAGWCSAFLDSDGRVHACQRSRMALGSLRDHSFLEIWNGPAYGAFRRQSLHPGGLATMQDLYDCNYCPHAVNHDRVHRIYRFVLPLQRLWNNAPARS